MCVCDNCDKCLPCDYLGALVNMCCFCVDNKIILLPKQVVTVQ